MEEEKLKFENNVTLKQDIFNILTPEASCGMIRNKQPTSAITMSASQFIFMTPVVRSKNPKTIQGNSDENFTV